MTEIDDHDLTMLAIQHGSPVVLMYNNHVLESTDGKPKVLKLYIYEADYDSIVLPITIDGEEWFEGIYRHGEDTYYVTDSKPGGGWKFVRVRGLPESAHAAFVSLSRVCPG